MKTRRLIEKEIELGVFVFALLTAMNNKEKICDYLSGKYLNESITTEQTISTNILDKVLEDYNEKTNNNYTYSDMDIITIPNTFPVFKENDKYICDSTDNELVSRNDLGIIYVVSINNTIVSSLTKIKGNVTNLEYRYNGDVDLDNYIYLKNPTEEDYESLSNGFSFLYNYKRDNKSLKNNLTEEN